MHISAQSRREFGATRNHAEAPRVSLHALATLRTLYRWCVGMVSIEPCANGATRSHERVGRFPCIRRPSLPRIRPNLGRHRPNLGRARQKVELDQSRVDIKRLWPMAAKVDPESTKVGRIRANSCLHRPESAGIMRNLTVKIAQIAPNSVVSGADVGRRPKGHHPTLRVSWRPRWLTTP